MDKIDEFSWTLLTNSSFGVIFRGHCFGEFSWKFTYFVHENSPFMSTRILPPIVLIKSIQQIKLHPTRRHYPLITYLIQNNI